jgi:hypothetical protein
VKHRFWILALSFGAARCGQVAEPSRAFDSPLNHPCALADCETIGERAEPLPRPSCPALEPAEGEACASEQQVCTYGESSTSHCRPYYRCVEHAWQVPEIYRARCVTRSQSTCPSEPAPGTDCVVDAADVALVPCDYGAGVGCVCVGSRIAFGASIDGDPGSWECNGAPRNGACPELVPNVGEGCDRAGQNCTYGPIGRECAWPYASVVCESGAWQLGEGGGCPE